MGVAGVLALAMVVLRLSGLATLGPWGATSSIAAQVLAVSGSACSLLPATFNYLVSLLHQRPARQRLSARPLFRVSASKTCLRHEYAPAYT